MEDLTKIVSRFYKYNFLFNASQQNERLAELLPVDQKVNGRFWGSVLWGNFENFKNIS